jgi:flagellar biosynthesis/type III secretory pathway protein FliH
LQETEETLMGTMAERLLREGLEQGLEKGLEKGREEGWEQGQRALLIELLETKFGKLDEQARRQVDSADVLARKRYAQRALTATTLDEVFAAEA